MNIELKDFNVGSEKDVSQSAAETNQEDILKSLIKSSLKEDSKSNYQESCRVLKLLLLNIIKSPDDEKFRKIKKKNPKFHSAFGKYECSKTILEVIGFEELEDSEDPIYFFAHSETDLLALAVQIIDKTTSRSEFLADLHEKRLKNPQSFPVPITNKKEADMLDQLNQYRQSKKKNHFGNSKPRIITISDLNRESNTLPNPIAPVPVYNSISSFYDPNNYKLRAFELSNLFRASLNLKGLYWDERLSEIARGHSEDMGEKRVPFGHQGFNKRFKNFPFRNTRGGAENVAYCYGASDPAKVSVDGWIKSPGHRKNLVGNFTYMAIGVYVNSAGYCYFTQLFALV